MLNNLLVNANAYLCGLTDGRFSLYSQPGSLTLLIRDAFNANVLQTVGNLSGGESFMVSLSLALGLSAMLRVNASVDVIFIDEGFGTLDDSCLERVIALLERLHELNGRRVGVISHVAELSERIPTQIRVERIDNTRSRVLCVNPLLG